MILDSEKISTPAGEYLIEWVQMDDAEQPYQHGFGFAFDGGRDRNDVTEGPNADDILADIKRVNQPTGWKANGVAIFGVSSAGIARYLRLKYDVVGVRVVDYDYQSSAPSTDREKINGIAWAYDWRQPNATNEQNQAWVTEYADQVTDSGVAEFRAWANGDTFGWRVTGPSGETVDDCWGYYGLDRERDYTRSEAVSAIGHDVAQRQEKTNLVGAGFVGII